jgi:hypothetical protein
LNRENKVKVKLYERENEIGFICRDFSDCLMTVLIKGNGLTSAEIKAIFLLVLKNYFIDKAELNVISFAAITLYQNFGFKISTQDNLLSNILSDAIEIDDKISVNSKEKEKRLRRFFEYFQRNLYGYSPLNPDIWEKYTKRGEPKDINDAKKLFFEIIEDFKREKISKTELSYLLRQIGNFKVGKECFYQDDKIYNLFFVIPSVEEIIISLTFHPEKLNNKFDTKLLRILKY